MAWTPEQEAEELARAELWRAQAQRRLQYQQWLYYSRLAGSSAAAAQVQDDWDAVVQWLFERNLPRTDPEDDPEFDPLGLSDMTNVGT